MEIKMPDVRARQFAIDTRMKLGLHSTEYFDVYRALSSLGITCIKRPLESDMSGATIKSDGFNIIFVNSSRTLGHQNFTIAHEIYHCLYDENLTNKACKAEAFGSSQEAEGIADMFAAYLLMPEDALYNQLKLRGKLNCKLTASDIVNLEQYCSVSRQAICHRLLDLGLIDKNDTEQLCQNVIQSARVLGKSTDLYKPTKESSVFSDYAEKANEALGKGLISESRYEEILADAGLLEDITGEGEEEIFAD
jgi:Zn-dependent peptidase ImmA (M78 family)